MNNKKNNRSEVFEGIVDPVHSGDRDKSNVGKRVILPASFTAGSRSLMQNYQDATVIYRHYGYPKIFLTFTCNPKW